MARPELLYPFIGLWEGLYSNNPNDKGGVTMRGITWGTYQALCKIVLGFEPTVANHAALTVANAQKFILYFWNQCKASGLNSQRIANMIVDWNWGSGYWAIVNTRRGLNKVFGVGLDEGLQTVTSQMIAIINSLPEQQTFDTITAERRAYYGRLNATGDIQMTSNYHGWLNRLNDLISKSPIPAIGGSLLFLAGLFFLGTYIFKNINR